MFNLKVKNPELEIKDIIDKGLLPEHIGIIMDGNGRWAKRRGQKRTYGHKKGSEAFKNITEYCGKIGIKYLTVYAFSTENWKRPPEEVSAILNLLREYLDELFSKVKQGEWADCKINIIGDISRLDDDIREKIAKGMEMTKDNNGICVNIALNYGGRDEITAAAKMAAQDVLSQKIGIDDITEEYFETKLYTAGQPDPDLIIRPSGEMRLSNFLVWQAAYSEFVFMNVLWPDFSPKHLNTAIKEFVKRNRRFGGI